MCTNNPVHFQTLCPSHSFKIKTIFAWKKRSHAVSPSVRTVNINAKHTARLNAKISLLIFFFFSCPLIFFLFFFSNHVQ